MRDMAMGVTNRRVAETVVRVGRDRLAACMTCPLCQDLFVEATTISECLHTFCRKCIHDNINDGGLHHCPVCKIKLGGSPTEKLRPDHNLQYLRAKIFSIESPKSKVNELTGLSFPKVESEGSLSISSGRRKERSISSLVKTASKLSAKKMVQKAKSMNRKKQFARGREHQSLNSSDESLKDLSSPGPLKRFSFAKKLTTRKSGLSNKSLLSEREQLDEEKADLSKPISSLFECASKSHMTKSSGRESDIRRRFKGKTSTISAPNVEELDGYLTEVHESYPSSITTTCEQQQLKNFITQDLNIPDGAYSNTVLREDKRGPVWFSLIASSQQGGGAPLPQISSCYLRVKDGSVPISAIKKYLVHKLGLRSDSEVEIWLQGQPVVSTLQLHKVVDWWLQTSRAGQNMQNSTTGSSAEDFIMVLFYGRKP